MSRRAAEINCYRLGGRLPIFIDRLEWLPHLEELYTSARSLSQRIISYFAIMIFFRHAAEPLQTSSPRLTQAHCMYVLCIRQVAKEQ